MKQGKKYLAAAGISALVLVAAFSLKNYGNKAETEHVKNNTMVQENLQTETEESVETEANSILSAKENPSQDDNSVEQEQSVSGDEIKSEINNLINTYYESYGDTDKGSSDAGNQTSENKTADAPELDKSQEDEQTADIQATEKQTADDQASDKQATEKEKKESDRKKDIIEKYQDIKTYIKPGLEKDSYVVFTTYNIKLYNIDTLVPGMSSLVVDRDESGILSINKNTNDKKLNDYINKLSKEKDIKKVIQDVNSKLTAAVKKDTSLQVFMDYLK